MAKEVSFLKEGGYTSTTSYYTHPSYDRNEGVLTSLRLLTSFVDFYNQGHLRPIDPIASFDAKQIARAFRHLEDGDHLGKIVVTFAPPELSTPIESLPQRRSIEFDPAATYLLVGGVGGLGRSIAVWMVERGARSLMFLSRSAGKSDVSKVLFREIESMGCSVTAVAGRVDRMEDVEEAIRQARSPIKGVIQLAMVLRVRASFNV